MDNIFIKMLKLGTTVYSIAITSSFTIGLNIYNGLPSNTEPNTLCDKALYISISVVLIQILVQQYFIRESTDTSIKAIDNLRQEEKNAFDNIAYIKNEKLSIVFPKNKNKINTLIGDIFHSGNGKSIKIICYGTSGYGKVIDLLTSNYKKVKIEVILCSPNLSILNNQIDKDVLRNFVKKLKDNNVSVYISEIPPTIRASLIYNSKNKPIWCSIQPYLIFSDRPQFRGADYTPSIIADENNPIMISELSEIFLNEFERLKNSQNSDNEFS